MTARILDGNALSATVRERLAQRAKALAKQDVTPALAVILVGDDPASAVYVRNKVAACEKTGVRSLKFSYPSDASPSAVLDKIASEGMASLTTAEKLLLDEWSKRLRDLNGGRS